MNDTKRGACLCGAITFEIAPPYRWFAHCHCSMCRKHHGGLYGTGVGVPRERFRWLTGHDEISHYRATGVVRAAVLPALRLEWSRPNPTTPRSCTYLPAWSRATSACGRARTSSSARRRRSTTITDSLPQFQAYPPGLDLPIVARPQPPAGSGSERVVGSCLCGTIAYEVTSSPRRIVSATARSAGAASARRSPARSFCLPKLPMDARQRPHRARIACSSRTAIESTSARVCGSPCRRSCRRRSRRADPGRLRRYLPPLADGRACLRRLEGAVGRDHGQRAAVR